MKINYMQVSSIVDIKKLRKIYLDSMIQDQELYLELIVQKSKYFIIKDGDALAGYFIVFQDRTLVEFYIDQNFIREDTSIFKNIIKSHNIKSVLCKSFDHILLKLSLNFFRTSKIMGHMFRDDIKPRDFSEDSSISVRQAEQTDYPFIFKLKKEVFDTKDEIIEYIGKKKILIFQKSEKPIGFGIFSRTIEDRNSFDIGVAVSLELRGNGYGSYIIRHLKNLCYKNGWIPTCGCALENTASKKCVEKAGFISKYSLVHFSNKFDDKRATPRNVSTIKRQL